MLSPCVDVCASRGRTFERVPSFGPPGDSHRRALDITARSCSPSTTPTRRGPPRCDVCDAAAWRAPRVARARRVGRGRARGVRGESSAARLVWWRNRPDTGSGTHGRGRSHVRSSATPVHIARGVGVGLVWHTRASKRQIRPSYSSCGCDAWRVRRSRETGLLVA